MLFTDWRWDGVSQVFSGIIANGGNLHLKNFRNIGFSETQSASDLLPTRVPGNCPCHRRKNLQRCYWGKCRYCCYSKHTRESGTEGKATGVISTSSITHATPASFVAHQPNREWLETIAADFLKTNIDVFIGGGSKNFTHRRDKKRLNYRPETKRISSGLCIEEIAKISSGKLAGFTSDYHNKSKLEGRGSEIPIATSTAINILDNDPDGFS
jgi:alkaline phosphatase